MNVRSAASGVTSISTLVRPREIMTCGYLVWPDVAKEDVGRRLSLSSSRNSNIVALELWDDEAVHRLAVRQV